MKEKYIDTLARTIYGEARSESVAGMEAIANVVLNRFAVSRRIGTYWWGNTIEQICRKRWQFSCWNADDPNLKIITFVTERTAIFALCLHIARRAVDGRLKDNTGGATHYLNPAVANPKWDDGETPTARIGRHVFYRPKEVPKL